MWISLFSKYEITSLLTFVTILYFETSAMDFWAEYSCLIIPRSYDVTWLVSVTSNKPCTANIDAFEHCLHFFVDVTIFVKNHDNISSCLFRYGINQCIAQAGSIVSSNHVIRTCHLGMVICISKKKWFSYCDSNFAYFYCLEMTTIVHYSILQKALDLLYQVDWCKFIIKGVT